MEGNKRLTDSEFLENFYGGLSEGVLEICVEGILKDLDIPQFSGDESVDCLYLMFGEVKEHDGRLTGKVTRFFKS